MATKKEIVKSNVDTLVSHFRIVDIEGRPIEKAVDLQMGVFGGHFFGGPDLAEPVDAEFVALVGEVIKPSRFERTIRWFRKFFGGQQRVRPTAIRTNADGRFRCLVRMPDEALETVYLAPQPTPEVSENRLVTFRLDDFDDDESGED